MKHHAIPILLAGFCGGCLSASAAVETESLTIRKAFHGGGIPRLRLDQRVDLTFKPDSVLVMKGKNTVATVPFTRIRRVQLLSADRHYPGATYAAVLAAGYGGAFLILKKRKVDVLLVEYVNERGGQMGMILQMPKLDSARSRSWLERFNIQVEDPAPTPAPQQAKK